jgi:hypothetical protein
MVESGPMGVRLPAEQKSKLGGKTVCRVKGAFTFQED